MKVVCRMLFVVLCMSLIIIGCKKDTSDLNRFINPEKIDKPLILRPYLPQPTRACVYDYDILVLLLGSPEIKISAVMLEDDTLIPSDRTITSMYYEAVEQKEDYSLFRSQCIVHYNLYGYQQSNCMDSWSLGCIYESAGLPPYTNIKKQGTIIWVNTSFSWSLPPHAGKRISYLIIE